MMNQIYYKLTEEALRTNYDDTMNLMRYNNHFMYIKNLQQIRYCYKCKNVLKYLIDRDRASESESLAGPARDRQCL